MGIGEQYDKIAAWWHNYHSESDYGISQLERAISYCKNHGSALDVGCGSGRMIKILERHGFSVTGIDASEKMIEIAKTNHASSKFFVSDIGDWRPDQKYDLIVAWDSIFHLPLAMHSQVVPKLCRMLQKDGILMYTFGDDYGEHESDWQNDKFSYSTIGITGNVRLVMEAGCQCRHLELDQFPEKHVCMIVRKE